MTQEAEIVSLAPEPQLKYFFVTTETKIDGYLLEHWLNVIDEILDHEEELRARKNNLRELVELLSQHDLVAGVFKRLPCLKGEDWLSEEFEISHEEMFRAIEKEKQSRLQIFIEEYREFLEREHIVGVFISDMNDQFKEIYVPSTYKNPLEVKAAINKSIGKVMTEVYEKFPPKRVRKERPGEILVANVTVGTEIDKRLIENWMQFIQDDANFNLELKNKTFEILNLQANERIAVPPFNSFPIIGQGDNLNLLDFEKLEKDKILTKIDAEKQNRLKILGETHFRTIISGTRRKAVILVTDYNLKHNYQVINENVSEADRERLSNEIECREYVIEAQLKDLQESEAQQKAAQFKEEALEVLQTHIERQKTALIPELDVFTGAPRLETSHIRPKSRSAVSSEVDPEQDLIDFTTPRKKSPSKDEKFTPEKPSEMIYGDLLTLEGPMITPISKKTRRNLSDEPIDLLNTTPPILIMARPPLEPEKVEWWDMATQRNEIIEPLQPTFDDKPQKSFMEAASDWIKYAQVTLSHRETKAGIDLWSDILGAPSTNDPIEEPKIPEIDEENNFLDEKDEEKDILVAGL